MPSRFHTVTAMLAGAALVALMQPLSAQEDNDDRPWEGDHAQHKGATPSDNAPIVVTGSRIRGASIAGEVTTLDREAIISAGQIDLGEALRSLPQNFSGGQNPGVGTGAGQANSNLNSTSSPNLRGLGRDATLTLLNGHRLPHDGALGGVDISAIPLAALDRIEVVPDGASAVYGSDAVAGVVNVILRRDFEGVATSGQLGTSTDGGYFRQQADIVSGSRWDGGGFLLAYDFVHNSHIAAGQRAYTRSLDPDTSLYPSQHRHAVTLSAHHRFAEGVKASVDALYSRRQSQTISGTATSHYLRQPEVESYSVAPSLEVGLGSDWQAKVLGVFGSDRTHYSTAITPAGGTATITSGCYCNSIASLEAGVEGPLFALPGGSARIALGAGFRNSAMDFTRVIDGVTDASFDVTRRSRFAYGEIHLPLVSPETGISGIRRLSLSGALRYEDYPGLASVGTPRFGLIYSPLRGVTLRSTWARSFKAPTLYQQHLPYQVVLLPAAAFGASGGTAVMYASGGNPNVKPERARSWTAGFELRPPSLPGLTVAATWFDVQYSDRVVQPIAGSIAAAFRDPGYATLIDFAPNASELGALIAGSQFGLENFSGSPYDPASVAALVDNRNLNVAAQAINGIDAKLSWSSNIGAGRTFGFDLSGTWLHSAQRVTRDLPDVPMAGTIFNPPEFQARGTASYRSGGFRISSSLNFTGTLEDERFETPDRIAPNATVDLSASYDIIPGAGRDPGLTISLIINNLLNDRPQVIRTTGPTDTPYDSTNFSPIGRFVAVGIRRHW